MNNLLVLIILIFGGAAPAAAGESACRLVFSPRSADTQAEVKIDTIKDPSGGIDWSLFTEQTVRLKFEIENENSFEASFMKQMFGESALKGKIDLRIRWTETFLERIKLPISARDRFYQLGFEAAKEDKEVALVGIARTGEDFTFSEVVIGTEMSQIAMKDIARATDQLIAKTGLQDLSNVELMVIHTHPGSAPFNLADKNAIDDFKKIGGFKTVFGAAVSAHTPLSDSISFVYVND